jgi:hypothetical protein
VFICHRLRGCQMRLLSRCSPRQRQALIACFPEIHRLPSLHPFAVDCRLDACPVCLCMWLIVLFCVKRNTLRRVCRKISQRLREEKRPAWGDSIQNRLVASGRAARRRCFFASNSSSATNCNMKPGHAIGRISSEGTTHHITHIT